MNNAETDPQKLPIHELGAVCILMTILILLTFVSNFNGSTTLPDIQETPSRLASTELEVTVEGAVENPGTFLVKSGALVGEVLELAKPLPEADLKKVKLKSKLSDGRTITVPEYAKIEVHLEGAVMQKTTLRLRKGALLSDLLEQVEFEEDADLKPFKKKRKLKDGEVITVKRLNGLNNKSQD